MALGARFHVPIRHDLAACCRGARPCAPTSYHPACAQFYWLSLLVTSGVWEGPRCADSFPSRISPDSLGMHAKTARRSPHRHHLQGTLGAFLPLDNRSLWDDRLLALSFREKTRYRSTSRVYIDIILIYYGYYFDNMDFNEQDQVFQGSSL